MATTEPQKWSATLGANADVNSLPATTPAGSGRASTSGLFPQITQKPLDEGGIAPERADFNALFKYLGDYIYYVMQGGVFSYLSTYAYTAGNLAMFSGAVYECIAANGPGNVHAPTDTAYWRRLATLQDIPPAATVNDGQLTINVNGSAVATFTANQAGNSTADITVPAAPTVGDGTITVHASGTPIGSFTTNQGSNSVVNIPEATDSAFGVVKTDQHGFDVGALQGWVRLRSGVQIVWGAGSDNSPITFLHPFNTVPTVTAMCSDSADQGSPFGSFPCFSARSNTGMTIRVWKPSSSSWLTTGTFTYIAIGTWG